MEDKLSREEVLHVADLARISLTEEEISKYHCEEIGKVLAKIHNIDLRNENNDFNEKNIDFVVRHVAGAELKVSAYAFSNTNLVAGTKCVIFGG